MCSLTIGQMEKDSVGTSEIDAGRDESTSYKQRGQRLSRQSFRHVAASLAVFWWLDCSFFVRKGVFGRTFRPRPTLQASLVGRIFDGQRAKYSKLHLHFCGLQWHALVLINHKQMNNPFE